MKYGDPILMKYQLTIPVQLTQCIYQPSGWNLQHRDHKTIKSGQKTHCISVHTKFEGSILIHVDMNAEKWTCIPLSLMKLRMTLLRGNSNSMCHDNKLMHIRIRFIYQIGICYLTSKSPFPVFGVPEGKTFPNQDENPFGCPHLVCGQ